MTTCVLTLLLPAASKAGIITFENMPEEYWFNLNGENIAIFWEGVTFGPEATILESEVCFYADDYYPQHSGTSVLFSNAVPYIDADLEEAVNEVSLWYTCNTTFYMDAYDAEGNIVASNSGPENLTTNSYLSVSTDENIITRVHMYNASGENRYFTIDDFETVMLSGEPRPVQVPEPSILPLLLCSIFCIGLSRKPVSLSDN